MDVLTQLLTYFGGYQQGTGHHVAGTGTTEFIEQRTHQTHLPSSHAVIDFFDVVQDFANTLLSHHVTDGTQLLDALHIGGGHLIEA